LRIVAILAAFLLMSLVSSNAVFASFVTATTHLSSLVYLPHQLA
jgi:hypothetical protein